MRPMTLEALRRAVRGRWLTPPAELTVRGVSTDTRSVRAGELFIPLRGERFDGHAFLAQAADAGCQAVLVNADFAVPDDVRGRFRGLVAVADTTAALADLGSLARGQLSATVIGVTGSVGKTTVKRMIHQVLQGRLTGGASPKSFNNHVGVPLTLLAAPEADDYLICEVGTSGPGEIGALARIVQPDVAVITAVGASHLERLGSVERVAVEKASLLGSLAEGGLAVVTADSPELTRALRAWPVKMIRFGQCDSADLRLTGYEPRGLGQRFQVNGRLWVELPLPGRHNALNALAALAVARRFGLDEREAAEALAQLPPGDMRLEARQAGPVTVINDAYNANPASMAAALAVLADLQAGRKVLIAGDMRELGPAGPALHAAIGRPAATVGLGLLVTVGELSGHLAEAARAAAGKSLEVLSYPDAASAAEAVNTWLTGGDLVLVKASRSMGLEAVARRIETCGTAMGGPPMRTPARGTCS